MASRENIGPALAAWVADHRAVCSIVFVFVLSRALARALGVSFDYDNIDESWQLLDTHILRHQLAEGLLYLHAQPPFFNLLVGLFLQAFGQYFGLAMGALYAISSLAGLLCFYALARQFVRKPGLALALTLLLSVAPETILYENKLYYEGLVAWWLVIGFYGLHRCVASGRPWGGLLAFVAFALVVLTRSAFHPGWLLGLAVLVVLLIERRSPAIWVVVCLPLLVVGAVMAKNLWVFGTSSLSSWGGINLAKMSVGPLAHDVRQQMVRDRLLSALSSVEPFSEPAAYLQVLGSHARTGANAADAVTKTSGHVNFNHGVYVPVGQTMMRDAMAAMTAYPHAFLSRLAASVYHFNRPPSEFKGLHRNLTPIAQYDRAFSLLVRGQPAALFGTALDAGRPQHPLAQVGVWSVALLGLSMAAMGVGLVHGVRMLRGRPDHASAWFIALGFTLAYAVAVVNVFDTWENNRARFMLEPLILLSVLALLARRGAAAPAQTR